MGVVNKITYDSFPEQSASCVGKRVTVCYHHDTTKTHEGTIVRNDMEEPFEVIIQLDNGRFVRGAECQYRIQQK